MAYLINIPTFSDTRGNLTVLDEAIPFDIKRLFYIYGVDSSARGGHRHHKTVQAAICIQGRCTIVNDDGEKTEIFKMDSPHKCLILETKDWHVMKNFTPDAILLVLASTSFDATDYIFDPYEHKE
ncbi:sugar 3,4-ketoisomerase [Mucilaginibacter jinjuensis]|uniref:FdtA/QdtA family cupin domain-containing protein n=1 Tax=Mucilaginibacter jinjuensis TaxID=1176721 RepID=A0ABY7TBC2_9SPHI|nr:FdtA/QdtA family cupin domain-containing protein [Mucilaginibacter jinjuensis]WCT13805.1 FdtA/QdtA family cupin domain-containing protein [Mucilaginibacter jinjuensis]